MKISIIGGGKVAFHLVKMLQHVKLFELNQILIRNPNSIELFSSFANPKIIHDYESLSSNTDILLIAVNDDEIPNVINILAEKKIFSHCFILHTSGKYSSEVFKPNFINFGIFYPLQTFTIERIPDYSKIPFCIIGSNIKTEDLLQKLASTISKNVYHLNDSERQKLHLGAVLVNNFTNHLYTLAQNYLEENNLSFEILKPLIQETVEKIAILKPQEAQTGPAVRGDVKTINQHLELLKKHKKLQKIYKEISKSINNDLKI